MEIIGLISLLFSVFGVVVFESGTIPIVECIAFAHLYFPGLTIQKKILPHYKETSRMSPIFI